MICVSQHIAAAPELVFDRTTDFEHAADLVDAIERVEMLTAPPVGVGTRFRETRLMFKKEATEEFTVTRFDPPRSYTLEANSCGARYTTEVLVEPHGDGSQVSMSVEVRPVSLMAWLFYPLSCLMSGMLRKCVEEDLKSIKFAIEGTATAMDARTET